MATVAKVESLTVGGYVFTRLNDLIVLYGQGGGAGSNSAFRRPNTSAGYQVPVGKILVLYAFRAFSDGGTDGRFNPVYADNDVGFKTSTGFTNPVWYVGMAGNDNLMWTRSTVSGEVFEGPLFFEIPENKYPSMSSGSGSFVVNCQVFGYLKDA